MEGTTQDLQKGSNQSVNHLTPVRILVIDDDDQVGAICKKYLNRQGYDVTTIQNPGDALDEFRKETYQIVILDLILPPYDGLELLKAIRKIDSDVCVILLTGHPSLETAIEGLKNYGAFDYLTKPMDLEKLALVIQKGIRKHGLATDPVQQITKEVGQRIRVIRKEKSLTMRQLSKRIGVSTSLISQIERGESSPSIPTLYKVSVALEAPLSELFQGY